LGKVTDKLAINWQNSFELDSNLSLLLEYGRKWPSVISEASLWRKRM